MTNAADTIVFLLVDRRVVDHGDIALMEAAAQAHWADATEWDIAFTDANEESERVLFESWVDEAGQHIVLAHGAQGLAAALTA